MTTLQERVGFTSDLADATASHPVVTPPGLAESVPSRRISITEAAAPAEQRARFGQFVSMVLNGLQSTFARSPKRPRREQTHYPPRFSIEFETSLVDRERRRL